jgi:hypothetical protein
MCHRRAHHLSGFVQFITMDVGSSVTRTLLSGNDLIIQSKSVSFASAPTFAAETLRSSGYARSGEVRKTGGEGAWGETVNPAQALDKET